MSQMRPLKERMIQETEALINKLREQREELQERIDSIEPQLQEAREMLSFLKTGKTSLRVDPRRATVDDALEALQAMCGEFTGADMAKHLGITNPAGTEWCKRFEREGLVALARKSKGGGVPNTYRRIDG